MPPEDIAEHLIAPLWRGLDTAYKRRYARTIWSQFEDAIRAAAYTSVARRFLDTICQRLPITLRTDDLPPLLALTQSGEDRLILRMLRDETTLIVLMVRVANEEIRTARQLAQQEALLEPTEGIEDHVRLPV